MEGNNDPMVFVQSAVTPNPIRFPERSYQRDDGIVATSQRNQLEHHHCIPAPHGLQVSAPGRVVRLELEPIPVERRKPDKAVLGAGLKRPLPHVAVLGPIANRTIRTIMDEPRVARAATPEPVPPADRPPVVVRGLQQLQRGRVVVVHGVREPAQTLLPLVGPGVSLRLVCGGAGGLAEGRAHGRADEGRPTHLWWS